MQMHKRLSKTMGGNTVTDETRDGYLIDEKGKVVGEARNFDPYSKRDDIMMYEIDSFGFTFGYLRGKYLIMSEEDLANDKQLIQELKTAKYEQWKRSNISELMREWDVHGDKFDNFDFFCRKIYDNFTKKIK